MKNLKKLGVIFSIGSFAALAFSVAACGDDDDSSGGSTTAGTGTTGGAGSGGQATTGGAGASTGGAGASTGGAGASTGGGGSGGAKGGSGGSGGSGGASGGSGGSGGASGGSGGGGSGGGGGAPSADCMKWCSGAMGLITECAGKLPTVNDSEAKCLALCNDNSAKGDMGLTCWNKHLGFIVAGMDKTTHCPHAAGTKGNGQCNEVPGQ